MADEKKPKIDLKARLGKTAMGGATPPPPATGGIPVPTPGPMMPSSVGSAPAAIPVPASTPSPGGLPVPPGIPVGPPSFRSPGVSLDPSNPLAAAVAPPASARPQAMAPQLQRIEVDDLTVQEARKGARRQGLIMGLIVGVVFGAIGYIAGGALETNKGRAQSVAHAKSLAEDVNKSRDQLKDLAAKLEAGKNALAKERKFPDSLARDLGGINVDFDGSKLAGVRFSGFKTETTTGLIEFISGVQATNDRKNALAGLLTKLEKPMTEQLAAAASGKAPPVTFVVLLNKDSAKNPFAVLAPLKTPIDLSASMPAEYTAIDPMTRANVTAPKLTSVDKPGAAYVVPKSIEAAFPSETAGQVAQLVGQLSRLIEDINGEPATPDAITEPKHGLVERADMLAANLNKVQ